MPAVSVLIVAYNSGPWLVECVRALAQQTMSDFEAIVVDNDSRDGAVDAAQAVVAGDERFVFDRVGCNLGFAGGNNRAARRARAPWLATLNPDAIAAPNWLATLTMAADRHPDVAAFGSTQLDAADPALLDGAGDAYFAPGLPWRGGHGQRRRLVPAAGEIFAPCAAAAMYRADAFRAAGGFDERFFCFIEDVDLGFKLRLAGHRCLQLGDAIVRHVGGASSGGDESEFVRYHCVRNIVWCFLQDMPTPLLPALLPAHFAVLGLIWWRGGRKGDRAVVASAVGDALRDPASIWRARQRNQSRRKASSLAIARALCWNPAAFSRREVRVRPLD
jgi:GT2 family glycosyltransferase